MNELFPYFLGVVAYNVATGLVAFFAVLMWLRKERAVTFWRGFVIYAVGLLGGSVLVFLMQIAIALAGSELKEPYEMLLSLIVLLPVMYAAFAWLGKERPDAALQREGGYVAPRS